MSSSADRSGGVDSMAQRNRGRVALTTGPSKPTQAHQARIDEQRRGTRYGSAPLGRTQKLVLHLLAAGHKSVANLAYDWPSLTESAAQGAITRLGDRGLVDLAGVEQAWGSMRRVYKLTDRGYKVARGLVEPSEGDEDA